MEMACFIEGSGPYYCRLNTGECCLVFSSARILNKLKLFIEHGNTPFMKLKARTIALSLHSVATKGL